MNWDGYTIFSLLSGLVLLLLALLGKDLDTKERIYALALAAVFGGYGVFVANQTSGTFYFPIWIFAIPFLGAAYLLWSVATTSQRDSRPARPPAAASSNTATSDGTAQWICPECGKLVAVEALVRHRQDCGDRRVETTAPSKTSPSNPAAKSICPDCNKLVAGNAWGLHHQHCAGRMG